MPLAAAPTGEATPIVETSNGASLPATFNLSVCWQHFFKPLANDRSLAPSGPSRRNMLGPLRVELTHSARGRATAAFLRIAVAPRRLRAAAIPKRSLAQARDWVLTLERRYCFRRCARLADCPAPYRWIKASGSFRLPSYMSLQSAAPALNSPQRRHAQAIGCGFPSCRLPDR